MDEAEGLDLSGIGLGMACSVGWPFGRRFVVVICQRLHAHKFIATREDQGIQYVQEAKAAAVIGKRSKMADDDIWEMLWKRQAALEVLD